MFIYKLNRKIILEVSFLSLAAIVSFLFVFARFKFNFQYRESTLLDLINYNAKTPFQYRILIPFLVKQFVIFLKFDYTFSFKLFEFIATNMLVIYFRNFLRFFISNKNAIILSFTLFIPLTYHFILSRVAIYYPWDIPSILFFVLALISIYKNNNLFFYLVFIIATFNRETSCFLSIIFLIKNINERYKLKLYIHLGAQIIIWFTIKYFLLFCFKNNTGYGMFINQFDKNIDYICDLSSYPYLLGLFSGTWIILLFTFRYLKNSFLKNLLWLAIPFIGGMMIVGVVGEIRIFGELIPIFLTLCIVSIFDYFSLRHIRKNNINSLK